ncbi:MAG: DUF3095 domain-containing protein [Alphaproteobacteria bacterium]|nr:DUF3095 domain-containing protein [Alphaproteobacteria bacterium]
MTNGSNAGRFFATVPRCTRFGQILDPELYTALPDDWIVGITDVVSSTQAIEAGAYKKVNMAGAAVIAAVSNALGNEPYPFVFGGDGASFALPRERAAAAREALARTATFVAEVYGLELRIAALPVAAVRAAGFDIRVARFAASPDLDYAMFAGGGLAWAEAQMKAGNFAIPPAPPGSRPDLTGLSCRFEAMPARRGVMLSIIVRPARADPAGTATPADYRAVVERIVRLIEDSPEMGRPVPDGGPPLSWPPSGLDLEARAGQTPGSSAWLHRLKVLGRTALSFAVLRWRLPVGRFDPDSYLRQLVANSDYRKYDDGLRMTIDCREELADQIEASLAAAAADGIVLYGLHRQRAALMTCLTPSVYRGDHIHFLDGAAGGYAAAALSLKERAVPGQGTRPGGAKSTFLTAAPDPCRSNL